MAFRSLWLDSLTLIVALALCTQEHTSLRRSPTFQAPQGSESHQSAPKAFGESSTGGASIEKGGADSKRDSSHEESSDGEEEGFDPDVFTMLAGAYGRQALEPLGNGLIISRESRVLLMLKQRRQDADKGRTS